MLTLTGTAGCGKLVWPYTSLQKVNRQIPGEVYWVELAQLNDPHLVPKALAKKLDVAEQPDRPIVDVLLDALHGKKVLIVLDNCEHMISACNQLAETLMTLPGVSILTTSREALGSLKRKHLPAFANDCATHQSLDR